jgi:transaldolase
VVAVGLTVYAVPETTGPTPPSTLALIALAKRGVRVVVVPAVRKGFAAVNDVRTAGGAATVTVTLLWSMPPEPVAVSV